MNFIQHAEMHGLVIDHLISDGRWHRVATEDKPKKRNGAYLYDGRRGVVKNWATMDLFAPYPERGSYLHPIDRKDLNERRKKADRDEALKHAKAAQEALRIISLSAVLKHPYLARKGFPDATGLVREGLLIIPVRDVKTNAVISLQTVGDEKKFLYGGRTKGGVLVIGKKWSGGEKYLCEGYATGLSVKVALDSMYKEAQVYVCFSASNLVYVAERIGGDRIVVADNDPAGMDAAKATGLPYVHSPVEGEDLNDLHQRAGIWELLRVMKTKKEHDRT